MQEKEQKLQTAMYIKDKFAYCLYNKIATNNT